MADSVHREKDHRRLRRHALVETIKVRDRVSQTLLGRIVNLHTEGLMIIGNHPFSENRIYQLKLDLPRPVDGRSAISLGVDCLWVRSDEDTETHWSGCKIIDASEEALRALGNLIELFGESVE